MAWAWIKMVANVGAAVFFVIHSVRATDTVVRAVSGATGCLWAMGAGIALCIAIDEALERRR
jgi:hypothetical protein